MVIELALTKDNNSSNWNNIDKIAMQLVIEKTAKNNDDHGDWNDSDNRNNSNEIMIKLVIEKTDKDDKDRGT